MKLNLKAFPNICRHVPAISQEDNRTMIKDFGFDGQDYQNM